VSYDMCVYYKDGHDETIPISGFFNFGKYWLKPRKALSLQIILDISKDSGLTLKRRRDIELLLIEMEKLKQYHLDRGMTLLVLESTGIDEMIERLKAIHADWDNIERVTF
jgi:hypothetical protein